MDSERTLSLSHVSLRLAERLRTDKTFRADFFRRAAQETIASQIKYLREIRRMRQADLASATGMKQSAISRLEQAEYSKWNWTTLARIADALDARIEINFRPSEDIIRDLEGRHNTRSAIGGLLSAIPTNRSSSRSEPILSRRIGGTNGAAQNALRGRTLLGKQTEHLRAS